MPIYTSLGKVYETEFDMEYESFQALQAEMNAQGQVLPNEEMNQVNNRLSDPPTIPDEFRPATNVDFEERWPRMDEQMDQIQLRGTQKVGDVVPYPGPKPNLRGKIDEYLGTKKSNPSTQDNITPLPILRPPKNPIQKTGGPMPSSQQEWETGSWNNTWKYGHAYRRKGDTRPNAGEDRQTVIDRDVPKGWEWIDMDGIIYSRPPVPGKPGDGAHVPVSELQGSEGSDTLVGMMSDDMRKKMLEGRASIGESAGGGLAPKPKARASSRVEAEAPQHLQDAVSSWAQGKMKASEVQKLFKKEGWSLDLRKGRYDVEAFSPEGYSTYISP